MSKMNEGRSWHGIDFFMALQCVISVRFTLFFLYLLQETKVVILDALIQNNSRHLRWNGHVVIQESRSYVKIGLADGHVVPGTVFASGGEIIRGCKHLHQLCSTFSPVSIRTLLT